MSLRIRRGTEAQRTGLSTIDEGELLWVTNAQKLYVGLGNGQAGNAGMINIGAALAGDGLAWDDTTQTLKFGGVNYTTDDVQEGVMVGRQYFTEERAVDAVAAALVAGTGNVTFVYNTTQDNAGRIDATVTLDGIGITSVEADTSPSLGGNLDASSYNITGISNLDVLFGAHLGPLNFTSDGVITTSNLPPAGIGRTDAPLYIGTNASPTTLILKSDENFGIFTGLTDGTNNAGVTFKISRGTLSVPTAMTPGDGVVFFDGSAYNGTEYAFVGAFGLTTDPSWSGTNGTNGEVPGQFGAIVLDEFGTLQTLSFNSKGVLSTPAVRVGNGSASVPSIGFTTDGSTDTGIFHPGDGIMAISTDGVERVRIDNGGMRVEGFMKVKNVNGVLPNPAEAGMIVLDNGIFKGYTGSVWADLN